MPNKSLAKSFLLVVLLSASSARGQTSAPTAPNSTAPALINLSGKDEKRAQQLDEQIEKALKADRWDEGVARAEELLALRAKAQGPGILRRSQQVGDSSATLVRGPAESRVLMRFRPRWLPMPPS